MNSGLQSQQGLTLVEILIALVLGLLVISIVGTAVQSQFKTNRQAMAMSRAQTQGRFAIEDIAMAVRSAGYSGCSSAAAAIPNMPLTVSGPAVIRSSYAPIQTFRIDSTGWVPSTPDGYSAYTIPTTGAGTPVPGTHALLVEGGVSEGVSLTRSTFSTTVIDVKEHSMGLEKGSMALISDCASSEAFFIDATQEIADEKLRLSAKSPLTNFYEVSTDYPEAVRVLPYRRSVYFIGDSGRTTEKGDVIRSLFEHVFPFKDHSPHEIVEGIEALVITHRQLQSDGTIKELTAGDSAIEPINNISMRIALLVSTPVRRDEQATSAPYVLSGITVGTGSTTGPTHADDERMRRVFEKTIMLRNSKATAK